VKEAMPTPTPPRRAVYTALMGGYERLREQAAASASDVDFICLTDDPSLTSSTWRVELIDAAFPMDSVRSARTLKIGGHPVLDGYHETIWVDNRVSVVGDPNAIFDELLADCDLFLFHHSFRDLVIDEFEAVVRGGYDDPARVYEQLLHYSEAAPSVLDERAIWTGFIPRRWTPEVRRAMALWQMHVLRYSRRDQLSINLALHQSPASVRLLEHDNRRSRWHKWPTIDAALERKPATGHRFQDSIRAPLAALREAGPVREDLIRAHEEAATARDAQLRQARLDIEALRKDVWRTGQQLKRTEAELSAILNSRSYRIARRLAAARGAIRR
jgi:hypothetical protein